MSPYYTIMRLPQEKQEEFILMLPFTPGRKDNLSAWMVARSDGDNYGQLVVYRFPKQKLVYGPRQIVARINQDAEISRQISLWDQRGIAGDPGKSAGHPDRGGACSMSGRCTCAPKAARFRN